MQTYDEIQELRLRQVENLLSAIIEGQSSLAQIMQEQTKRLDRLEELMTLALDDLAFIKEILKPGE